MKRFDGAGRLPGPRLAAYGVLAFPLAMAALPLTVHMPKFYGGALGLPLASVGAVLLAVRAWDAAMDPMLGWWSDRWRGRAGGRWAFILPGVPLLAMAMLALLRPPHLAAGALLAWFAASLIAVYTAYSLITVSYQALGAQLARDPHERTRVAAWREGFGLAGVLVAAALPGLLQGDERAAFATMAWIFVPLLIVCALASRAGSPRVAPDGIPGHGDLLVPFRNRGFRRLALVFVLNGTAAAIPATLVLFFVEDVLRAPHAAGALLATYFAAGALGLPAWTALARRVGKPRAWQVAMALSVAAFAGAFALGEGEVIAFFVVCALSGLALGADLALPAALLADVIDADEAAGRGRHEGTYFGLWSFITKANLALAAGIALPLVAAFGYSPQARDPDALRALAAVYALVPCALKLAALFLVPGDRHD